MTTRARLRRRLTGMAAALVAAAAVPAGPAAADTAPVCEAAPMRVSFPDVPPDGVFADAIACAAGYGVARGFADGGYGPGQVVTRAQAAGLLARSIELARGVALESGSNPYADVQRGGLGDAMLGLSRLQIMKGVSSTRFAPGDPLTRGQLAQILHDALATLGMELSDEDVDYADVPDDGFFAPAIAALTNAGVVQGYPDGTYRPGGEVTRGQLAAFVADMLRLVDEGGAFLPTASRSLTEGWEPLHGTLEHRRVSLAGPNVVNILRWDLDDPELVLNVGYAGDFGHRDDVVAAARRAGAVAAVNGGFWVYGIDPDGLLVRGGRMLSDTSVLTDSHRNIRSGFGLTSQGDWRVGVPVWNATVTVGDRDLRLYGLNRRPFPGDETVLATTPTHAGMITQPGRYLVLDSVPSLSRSGVHELSVVRMHVGDGPVAIEPGQSLLFINGAVNGVPVDDRVVLDAQMDAAWEGMRSALVAGPWLLADGEVTPEWQWRSEGFDERHTDVRHPRTAIGFTADGHGVIVTVDGRRPGASVGMTQLQTAALLQRLGVTDAVMLDGGGSTQLALDGQLGNRPDGLPLRRVATVVTLEPRG